MHTHAMINSIDAMMFWHIVVMNAVAPAIAYVLRARLPATLERTVFGAAALQIILLWGWHSPAALETAMHNPAAGMAMHLTLFLSALWFWSAVVTTSERGIWRALVALLVTGKLFCLLGALFAFSRTALYPGHAPLASLETAIADQQLAGLLMLAVCPLTYVGAALLLSIRWIRGFSSGQERLA
ncbi:MAG: cytochrome c oxidase assembly protein [Hoeflea sp.]|nr:cytochrome c oxidase assembly protein [Hoeflea sp.]